ncbi:MAG: hypothetical protein EP329_22715 [Deltaproteobacteria bacterium]|nr:MAG: hypothetical protein EP329_22715 [Deltaproteobacteria bacterium]
MNTNAPALSKNERTLGYLVAALAGVYVLSLLTVQLTTALDLGATPQLVVDMIVSTVHYGVLVLLALRIPQPALRVLAITVFAIFFVDGILARLGVFSLFAPWFADPPPYQYFQF